MRVARKYLEICAVTVTERAACVQLVELGSETRGDGKRRLIMVIVGKCRR